MTQVFVYGTLRQGQRLAWVLKDSEFKGRSQTLHRNFDMFSMGHFPAVVRGSFRIIGEVYQVNEKTLKVLDFVERVPLFYKRIQVPVIGHGECFIYMANQELAEDIRGDQDVSSNPQQIRTDIQARTKEWVWNR